MAASSLYAAYDKLNDAKTTESEGNTALKAILEAVSSEDVRIRRLIASFVAECAPKQKALAKESAQCFLKLLTDDESSVSKEALANMKRLKQESAFASELLQCLLSQLSLENDQIKAAFRSLAHVLPEDAFNLSRDALPDADDKVREVLLSLLAELLVEHRAEFAKKPAVEESISGCLLKVLEDVSKEEFGLFMPLLKSLAIYQQPDRANEIVEFLYRLSEADQVKLDDADSLEMFIPCYQQSGELFQRGADSTAFLSTLHSKLLVDLSQLDQTTTIALLRTTAEATTAGLTAEAARSIGPALYAELYTHLPEPEEDNNDDNDDTADTADAVDKGEPAAKRDKPGTFNYSYIECLLASVQGCIAKAPSSVSYNELRDLMSALDIVIARTTPYTRGLQNTLKVKASSQSEDAAQIKQLKTALCTIQNIRAYRLLLEQPDDSATAASIVFSWHAKAQEQTFAPIGRGVGRPAVAKVATPSSGKRGRIQGIYQPPSGRYSKNLGTIPNAVVDVRQHSTVHAAVKAVGKQAAHAASPGAGPTPNRRVMKGRGVSRRGSTAGAGGQKKVAASTRVVRKK